MMGHAPILNFQAPITSFVEAPGVMLPTTVTRPAREVPMRNALQINTATPMYHARVVRHRPKSLMWNPRHRYSISIVARVLKTLLKIVGCPVGMMEIVVVKLAIQK